MDSLPVPVCVYVRASRNLRFATDFEVDNADLYGYCASKKEDIYGFKLHLLTSTQGISKLNLNLLLIERRIKLEKRIHFQ